MKDIEDIFKEGLEDYQGSTPSKILWWRVYFSLLMHKIKTKNLSITLIALIISILSFTNIANSNRAKNETQSISLKNTIASNPIKKVEPNSNPVQISHQSQERKANNSFKNQPNTTHENTTIRAEKSNKSISIRTKRTQKNSNLKDDEGFTSERNNNVLTTLLDRNPVAFSKDDKRKDTAYSIKIRYYESEEFDENNTDNLQTFKPRLWQSNLSDLIFNLSLIRIQPLVTSNTKRNSPSVEVYSGITFNRMFVSSKTAEYQKYSEYREHSEKQVITPNFGINYIYPLKNWNLSVGVTYHRIVTEGNYLLPETSIDSTYFYYSVIKMNNVYSVIGVIPNPNNPATTIPVYGYISNPDTLTYSDLIIDSATTVNNFYVKQKYEYVEFPISLSRAFAVRNLLIEPAIGLSYGRLAQYESKIPNLNQSGFMSDEELNSVTNYNLFNGIVGVGLVYKINHSKAIFVRSELKYNLNEFFDKSFPISQRNGQFRLLLGMKFKI